MDISSEIEVWLKSALACENLTDFSVELEGNTEKGSGFVGDILFIHVAGTENEEKKQYDLALKCSKKSIITREKMPVRTLFLNEIHFFEKIVPAFSQFQEEKNGDIFSESVPKYYGKFVSENMEVIALQNLEKIGCSLWDRKKPLTRKHVDLVVREYARFHATSGALQDQRKEEFDELTKLYSGEMFADYMDKIDGNKLFECNIIEACTALEGQVDNEILTKLRHLEKQVVFVFRDMWRAKKNSVIVHGDSWNNNFMFHSNNGDITKPTKAVMLDWQLIELNSPIRDLSYFLFTTIGKEDINDLDRILLDYHETYSEYLRKLGSNPEKIYPRSVFLEEWKKFAKFGIVMSACLVKMVLKEANEVTEITDIMESGADLSEAFNTDIKNTAGYAERIKYIVEYAGKRDLL